MLSKEELLKYPNYLLAKYQSLIFRELRSYMDANNLSQKDIAERLSVSNAYVSQVLNGNFNFTLKKLIELGLMIGKIPDLAFVDYNKYSMYQDAPSPYVRHPQSFPLQQQSNPYHFIQEGVAYFMVDESANKTIIEANSSVKQ